MARKKPEEVIHVGDTIKIIKNQWVRRVGYRLHFLDLLDEVISDPRTKEALKVLGITNPSREFYEGLSKARVRQLGFGGRERMIHYHEDIVGVRHPLLMGFRSAPSDHTGTHMQVSGKRVVYTGVYYPGGRTADTPNGDGEYYSPELCHKQAHVLLRTWAGEIEVKNVERVWKNGTKICYE